MASSGAPPCSSGIGLPSLSRRRYGFSGVISSCAALFLLARRFSCPMKNAVSSASSKSHNGPSWTVQNVDTLLRCVSSSAAATSPPFSRTPRYSTCTPCSARNRPSAEVCWKLPSGCLPEKSSNSSSVRVSRVNERVPINSPSMSLPISADHCRFRGLYESRESCPPRTGTACGVHVTSSASPYAVASKTI